MYKKSLFCLLLTLFSANSFANEKDEAKCFIKGTVDLPKEFVGTNSYVGVYDISSKITDNKFCIEQKVDNRKEFYLYVFKDKNIILKNKIIEGMDDFKNINLNLEKAIAELACKDDVCSNKDIMLNLRLRKVKEYSDYLKGKYYRTINKNFSYEKIEKKMKKQERDIQHAKKDEKVEMSKESYFPLNGDLHATNYKSFTYKKSDKRKGMNNFLSNKDSLEGINNQSEFAEIALTHWLRYLYYYGTDFEFVGNLYTNRYKQELVESDNFEKPLNLAFLYKNTLRNKTKVRGTKDKTYFKKTTEEIQDDFKKKRNVIYNIKPDYVNIEFLFEDGAWKLNKFNVNERYLKTLKK